MLRNLLKFEVQLHTRTIGFWVALVLMFAVGLLFSSHEDFAIGVAGGERVKVNGAIPIAITISAFSLLSIFFAAVFVVTGVMRDDVHNSVEVMHATPVSTRDMLLSRMLGVWLVTVLSLTGLVLGTMAGPFMPWADAETFKAFNLVHYLQPFVFFVVINALLVAGIYTAIAVITRNRALVYVSAVGLLVLYLLGGVIAGEDPADWVAALVDPFGTTALAVETQFWPAAEQNENMAPANGWVGLNRLVFGVLGLALFGASFLLSTRGIVLRKTKRRVEDGPDELPTQVSPVQPSFGMGHTFLTFWTRLKFEYLTTVKSVAFMILIGIALVLFLFTLIVITVMGASTTLPTSQFMSQVALGSLLFPMLIIMVFFGSDIMWRDRTANLHGILDATPVRSVSLLLAKWGALAALLLTIILGLLLAGMVAQLIMGAGIVPVVPSTFLAIGIVSFFVGFFFQGMLVMFIQNFMPGRIIGMLVAAGILAGLIFFIGQLPFYHPLMNFGDAGAGRYSEMAGFSNPEGFWWEFAYWWGAILMLGAVSIWVWRRGNQVGLLDRLRSVGKRMSGGTLATAALGLALFLGFGYAGLQSYSAQNYLNSDQREARRAEFETLVGDFWQSPEPRITNVKVSADFYPSAQTAEFRGEYRIDNPFDEPIIRTTVFSGVGLENIFALNIEGAIMVTDEERADELREVHEIQEIEFSPPLQPGESRRVTFTTQFQAPTLTDGSDIARNGTFVNNTEALLTFGNLEAGFLTDPDVRRKHGLGERVQWPDREDKAARRYHLLTAFSGFADYVNFEAEVCTDEGQIPVAPGKFRSETTRDGRHCRTYQSINPILNFFSFLTADYAVRRDVWDNPDGDDVALEIYFHPAHDYNIDLMIEAMKTSLDVYTETFSPYAYAQLRIMEFPYSSFAQAFAGTVPFSENIGFVQSAGDASDPKRVDFATYVTMHEIGHQWFAHQLVGAYAKGSNVLSEGLTENATMLAYEEHYDFAKARRVHEERATRQYLAQRTFERDTEPVLAEAEGQPYLNYNKTSWVMWGMRQIMGNEPVQTSLKRFLNEHHARNGAPYPTTLELIETFKAEIDPKYHGLIDDYWNQITFWDLKFDGDVTVTPNGNGNGNGYDVTIPIELDKKYASEEDGRETSITEIDGADLNEWVQIGFYAENPKDDLGVNPISLETVRIDEVKRTLTLNVSEKPSYVVLDPNRALIERNVNDNRATVEEADRTES